MNLSFNRIVGGLTTIALLMNAGTVFAEEQSFSAPYQTAPDKEYVVVYKKQDCKPRHLRDGRQPRIQHRFQSVPAVTITASTAEIQAIKADPNVAYVEENITLHTFGDVVSGPSAEGTFTQWDLQEMNAETAWAEGFTGAGVKVAVLDTGIATHADLRVAGGFSAVDYTTSYEDDAGHGTHVAGTIAALHNEVGVIGVAPDAELYAVKVMDQTGNGKLDDILRGLDWAIENKMDIINISLGTPEDPKSLHDMIDKAYTQGILVVTATGNDGTVDGSGDTMRYPAKYSSAIAVAAVDSDNERSSFSSTGDKTEFAAPGEDVISTYLNGRYAKISGSSQAAPHVTGLLAILKQKYPKMTNVQLRAELQKHATDIGEPGRDPWYGYGVVSYKPLNEATPTIEFSDADNHWAKDAIDWAVEHHIVSGYTDDSFRPDAKVSEAEFLAMLLRWYNPEIEEKQTKGYWAAKYYDMATELNLPVVGTNDSRSAAKPLTRLQVAEIVAAVEGFHYSGDDAIRFMYANNYANGSDPDKKTIASYLANGQLTRAEAVQFIRNLDLLKGQHS